MGLIQALTSPTFYLLLVRYISVYFSNPRWKRLLASQRSVRFLPSKPKPSTKQNKQQKETYVRMNFSWYAFLYKLFIARKSSEALVVRKVDNAFHCIMLYLVDSIYKLDSAIRWTNVLTNVAPWAIYLITAPAEKFSKCGGRSISFEEYLGGGEGVLWDCGL